MSTRADRCKGQTLPHLNFNIANNQYQFFKKEIFLDELLKLKLCQQNLFWSVFGESNNVTEKPGEKTGCSFSRYF